MRNCYKIFAIFLFSAALVAGCSSRTEEMIGSTGVPVGVNAFSITDPSQLMKGPLAQGRLGDFKLSNNKISVIIQNKGKLANSCPFGGGIIDADIVRPDGLGQDNFGRMCPLVNIEWTVNYQDFEVVSDGSNGSAKVLKAYGTIDALDYLDLDFVAPVVKALTGQTMYFSPRYDDVNDPFRIYEDLRGINPEVVTTYTLEPNANYIKIETTYENRGGQDAKMPVGRFVNGSGQVHTLLSGLGFTPPPTAQIAGDAPAVIYVPFDGVDVSYGYFYDVRAYAEEGAADALDAQKMLAGGKASAAKSKRLISTSLTYSGVTGILFGDEFLRALPLGGPNDMKVNFTIPAGGSRTVTEFFVVGDGNAGSVFDAGMKLMDIPTRTVSGDVVDATGSPVKDATVVVQNENSTTVITYRTGADGKFSGELSTGADDFARAFGTGKYKIFVDKTGYHVEGTDVAGTCSPKEVDIKVVSKSGIKCVLGGSGIVELDGGVADEKGRRVPARMTIVGFDPSPDSHAGAALATTHGAGKFEDTWLFERPWGVVDVKYVNSKGTFGVEEQKSFRLEPGRYVLVFTRGVEYSRVVKEIVVTNGGKVTVSDVVLKKVVKTPGWISGDFHLHSIVSPDSALTLERRVLASAGEGMDVLQSSDHDWLTDYAPVVEELVKSGLIPSGALATQIGDEVSPNHYGHMNFFPLEKDDSKVDGGALDWTYSPRDRADPSPDFVMSPREIMEYFKNGGGGEGEKVRMVNHIADQPTSLAIVSSWVTTPAYKGLSPLSSYVEPSQQRLAPTSLTSSIPMPFGESDLVITDFTALELTISPELYSNALRETGLPQWFNFLNLGILVTGVADSDSHREIVDQLGTPRNFVASDVDPKDGIGSFAQFDEDAFAKAVNRHKVVVSAGPFIQVSAVGEDGKKSGVGDTVSGKKVKFRVDVTSPAWAWFDTIEVYANTEPLPADDDGVSAFKGVASDPKSFFAPYHVPKFYYEPDRIYTTADGSLSDWTKDDETINASVNFEMEVDERYVGCGLCFRH